jgi:TRAP transporter TAXI family solute receptor
MTIRDYYRAHRLHFMIEVFGVAVLIIAVLWAIIDALNLMPPSTVTMVTGPEGGAYHAFGERYRNILARSGIELRILPTAGSLENLNKLNDPRSGVKVGFLQGGITNEKNSPDLVSLGTMFYEPLWFFYRGDLPDKGLESLRGRRISIGPQGSGMRLLSLKLLALNGIDERFAKLLPFTPQEAGEQLLRGQLDAALMLTSWDSPVVRRLLASEHVELASFPRTDAYVALYPFLNKLVVPAGVGNLANNRPPENATLLATKASLVVRKGVHPAIQYLLLKAAEQIHSGPGIFREAGQFPAAESIDLPLSEEAQRFYRSGQPFLQRYLPVWLAVFVGRLLVLLIPVFGILYPIVRLTPVLFSWQMRRRIYKLYDELRSIEHTWEVRDIKDGETNLIAQLDRLEDKADHLWVPVSTMESLYLFKEHVSLVRQRLAGRQEKV